MIHGRSKRATKIIMFTIKKQQVKANNKTNKVKFYQYNNEVFV